MKQILLKFRLILTKTRTNSGQILTKMRWDLWEMTSWESNNLENMWYMELWLKTKYVLGFLKHTNRFGAWKKNNLRKGGGEFDRGQRFNVFFKASLRLPSWKVVEITPVSKLIKSVCKFINQPGLARAVLQTPFVIIKVSDTRVWLNSILPLRWEPSKTSCVGHLGHNVPIPLSGVWDRLVEFLGLSAVRLQFP